MSGNPHQDSVRNHGLEIDAAINVPKENDQMDPNLATTGNGQHVLAKERIMHRSEVRRSSRKHVVLAVLTYSHRRFELGDRTIESVRAVSTLDGDKIAFY